MNLNAGRSRGFSLVEAVVSTALAITGIVAVMGAFASINATRVQTRESELMLRLAVEKYDEVIATGEYESAPFSGDFDPQPYSYSVESATGVTTDLREVTVRVTSTGRQDDEGVEIRGMIFTEQFVAGGGEDP